jgi:hypothetical protein
MCFSFIILTSPYTRIKAKKRERDEHGREATKGEV